MAIERADFDDAPFVEETPARAARRPSTLAWLLRDLRRGWAAYRAENKRDWDKLVEEQARRPSLD